jgi:hypothetical protein
MTEYNFVPRKVGNSNCDGPVTGTPHPSYDYIARSTTGDDAYPTEACPRYLQVNGKFDNIQVTANINANGVVRAPLFVGALNGVASGNKVLPFDIPHVTKKGKRIRHIIAEGPEAGIYVRGQIKNSNIIELPEYWDGLIDPESITVTLTQIGYSQDLIVDSIEWGKKIKIKSGNGANIHCYYEVWAARWLNPMNHEEKLTVVYDGETPDDYPGGNQNFLIGGWDYDRRNPQWEPLDNQP